jgi:PhoH-like ATPase
MPKKEKEKILALDTNIISHDSTCNYHFEGNDVPIPVMVLEKLDNFKHDNKQINSHTRDF